MASVCFTPFKIPRVRVTKLDSCGVVVEGECSSVATDGIITVEMTQELEDREDFFQKNGDGEFCVEETDSPKLKWINLTITFCNVDPELVNIMTGSPLVMSDADEPEAIGYRTRTGTISTVNFGFEGWNRVTGQAACDGASAAYLYNLWPWVVEGRMGDVTYQNGTANFQVVARTRGGSQWSSGPYYVYTSEAAATLGDPEFLPDGPVTSTDHHLMFRTFMAPPDSACGCTAIPLVLADPAIAALEVTVTFPTGTLPLDIDWGDSSTTTHTTGLTAVHTYAGAGTYLITLIPRTESSQGYQVSVTVAP
jgi:hypothetical protein